MNDKDTKTTKKIPCEIYSRVCGFFRPVSGWNPGKKEEFRERTEYQLKKFERGC